MNRRLLIAADFFSTLFLVDQAQTSKDPQSAARQALRSADALLADETVPPAERSQDAKPLAGRKFQHEWEEGAVAPSAILLPGILDEEDQGDL